MKTFIPFAGNNPGDGIYASLSSLDDKRLGKQRVEAYQIWRIITGLNGTKPTWRAHPAVTMWVGYAEALALYVNVCCQIWEQRKSPITGLNYSNGKMAQHISHFKLGLNEDGSVMQWNQCKWPWWWGIQSIHESDAAVLYRKDTKYYRSFRKYSKHYPEYVWPGQLSVSQLTSGQAEEKHQHDAQIAVLNPPVTQEELEAKKQLKKDKAKALRESKKSQPQSEFQPTSTDEHNEMKLTPTLTLDSVTSIASTSTTRVTRSRAKRIRAISTSTSTSTSSTSTSTSVSENAIPLDGMKQNELSPSHKMVGAPISVSVSSAFRAIDTPPKPTMIACAIGSAPTSHKQLFNPAASKRTRREAAEPNKINVAE